MNDFWTSLALAAGLVLFIEGLLYAAAPTAMRRALLMIAKTPSESVRRMGLIAALLGLGLVWWLIG